MWLRKRLIRSLLHRSGMIPGDENRSGVSQTGTVHRATAIVSVELRSTGVTTPPMVMISGRSAGWNGWELAL